MGSTVTPPPTRGAPETSGWVKGEKRFKKPNEVTSKVSKASLSEGVNRPPALPLKQVQPMPLGEQTKTAQVAAQSPAFPSSKAKGLQKLTRAFLEQKAGVLKTIFLRLAISPATKVPGVTQKAFFSLGVSLGGVLGLISFPAVVANIADTISLIRDLRRKRQASPKNVLQVIFRQTLVKEPFLLDITIMAQGAVMMALSIGALTHKLSPVVLASLGVALKALGGAAGGLAILFGSIQIGLGIRGVLDAKKKLIEAEKARDEFNSSHPERTNFSLEEKLQQLHHANTIKQANREKAQAILKACMGSFMTVAGALGIATIVTGGWTALGIAIAGSVLGGIAIIVSVRNSIKEHRTDIRLQKEFAEILGNIDLKNDEKWKNLTRELGIQAHIPTEEREESLRNYCLGKTVGSIVIGAHRLPPKSS